MVATIIAFDGAGGAVAVAIARRAARSASGERHDRQMDGRWEFWIDRGGTFTDAVARRPDGTLAVHKLLSENPGAYDNPTVTGTRHLLRIAPTQPSPPDPITVV